MKKYSISLIIALSFTITANAQTLDDYLIVAAENNPGLKAKYKYFEAGLEGIRKTSGLPDPKLSFGYFISPVETRVGPQQARFSLTQLFPWFGSLSAREDVAAFSAESRYQTFLEARNKLYYEVSEAYYALCELQSLIDLESENQRILSSYKDIATVQLEHDNGTMVDVLRADIMLNDASTELSILIQKKKPLETRFNKLLNRDEKEPIALPDSTLEQETLPYLRMDSIPSSHPLLEELDLMVKANEAQVRAVNKEGLPMIGLGVDYVIVGERQDVTLDDNGKDVFMPMITLSLPIFRGKYKAAKQEAQRMQESYELRKEEVSNMLTSTYQMVRFEIQKQFELIRLYEGQIDESKHSLNLLYSSYSNSGKDFEEVLRMQQQILKYQKLKTKASYSYRSAIAKLHYITANTN